MKKRESDTVDKEDTTKPSTSMVDIVVRIKENDTFGNKINIILYYYLSFQSI